MSITVVWWGPSRSGRTVTTAEQPLAVRIVKRLVTAVVAVVVAEVVGLGLYMGLLKPSVLSTVLSGPSSMQTKMLVAGNADVLLVACVLAILGLSYALRSDPTGATDTATETESATETTSTTTGDDAGGFAFGDGE